jgi:hypothetical protein
MKIDIQPGQIYRYHKYDKGGVENNYTYEIMDVAFDTSHQEQVIVYKPLYESEKKLFTRPLSNFSSSLQKDGRYVSKFALVKE